MGEKMDEVYRQIPAAQLHLERVEAAGMGAIAHALNEKDMKTAWSVAKLLRYLSIA